MSQEEAYQNRIEAIGEQLRAKISSKFQTSTFLAGFAFTILGIQISELWQSKIPQLLPVSISLMLLAVFLYIGAIIKLDELTMPKLFWDIGDVERPSVMGLAYLSEGDLRELKQRMVFYWMGLTVVATSLTAISLLLMLLPVPPQELLTASDDSTKVLRRTFSYTVISLVLMLVYFAVLYSLARRRFNPLLKPMD